MSCSCKKKIAVLTERGLECRNPYVLCDIGKASVPACGSTSEGSGRPGEESLEDKKAANWCLETLTCKGKKTERLRESMVAIFKCVKLSSDRKGIGYSPYWDRANGSVRKLQHLDINRKLILLLQRLKDHYLFL